MALSRVPATLLSGTVGADSIADSAISSAKLANGAAISNIGFTPQRVAYHVPTDTYYNGSTYLNRDVRLFRIVPNSDNIVIGELTHVGDFNYANMVSRFTFAIFGWSGDSTYKMNIKEHHGSSAQFAITSDGWVWFRNNDLWTQESRMVVAHASADFSQTGAQVTRESHSLNWHTCNANSTIVREANFGA
jgi:hypothetical protein